MEFPYSGMGFVVSAVWPDAVQPIPPVDVTRSTPTVQLQRDVRSVGAGEDAARHKRQVPPGDHRRKLRPETIAAMNAVIGEELGRFGYAA